MTDYAADDASYIARRMRELELERSVPKAPVVVERTLELDHIFDTDDQDWDYGT